MKSSSSSIDFSHYHIDYYSSSGYVLIFLIPNFRTGYEHIYG